MGKANAASIWVRGEPYLVEVEHVERPHEDDVRDAVLVHPVEEARRDVQRLVDLLLAGVVELQAVLLCLVVAVVVVVVVVNASVSASSFL